MARSTHNETGCATKLTGRRNHPIKTQTNCGFGIRREASYDSSINLGTNGFAVARCGLILSQDGATGSRKVSRYLPSLREAMQNKPKMLPAPNKLKRYLLLYFSVYYDICLFGGLALGSFHVILQPLSYELQAPCSASPGTKQSSPATSKPFARSIQRGLFVPRRL